jgi:uncharacterized protein (TIGR00730 family)
MRGVWTNPALTSGLPSPPMAERRSADGDRMRSGHAQPHVTVCVFCASSEAVSDADRAVAAELGRALASEGWGLVYGGGAVGLMGEVARAALGAGGHVTGVIPHRLDTREVAFRDVTELIRTDTMRERKGIMDARSDAFVILPGGIGTLEELLEIITLKQLGYHDRPVVLLDPRGFWEPLRAQLDRIVEEGLAPPTVHELWDLARNVTEAFAAIRRGIVVPSPAGRRSDAEALEAIEAPPRDRRE